MGKRHASKLDAKRASPPEGDVITYSWHPRDPYSLVDGPSDGLSEVMA